MKIEIRLPQLRLRRFTLNLEISETKVSFVRKFTKESKGATAIEYGLIAAPIAVAAVSAMSTLGSELSTTVNNVSTNMKAS